MKTTQKKVYSKLFKKLSALRATLSNEERKILDNIVGVEEVAAHKMQGKLTPKANPKAQSKANPKHTKFLMHTLQTIDHQRMLIVT